jgi:hypothetical protein
MQYLSNKTQELIIGPEKLNEHQAMVRNQSLPKYNNRYQDKAYSPAK